MTTLVGSEPDSILAAIELPLGRLGDRQEVHSNSPSGIERFAGFAFFPRRSERKEPIPCKD